MDRRSRSGFTLIELSVVVAIVTLLSLILLSAVQSAREAARSLECKNRLKGLGIAVNQHISQYGTLPLGYTRNLGASYLINSLQFMEQSVLYDSLNLSAAPKLRVRIDSEQNFTVVTLMPATLSCPSDLNRTIPEAQWASNYAGNCGRSLARGEGVFISKPLSPRDITDGFSNTVALSEWIVGNGGYETFNRNASVYSIGRRGSSLADFVSICNDLNPTEVNPILPGIKGKYWVNGGFGSTLYNHVMTPNKPSCTGKFNVVTAGSFHSNGLNILTLDGGVHFVKNSINPTVWVALGTRSMGETTNDPFGL